MKKIWLNLPSFTKNNGHNYVSVIDAPLLPSRVYHRHAFHIKKREKKKKLSLGSENIGLWCVASRKISVAATHEDSMIAHRSKPVESALNQTWYVLRMTHHWWWSCKRKRGFIIRISFVLPKRFAVWRVSNRWLVNYKKSSIWYIHQIIVSYTYKISSEYKKNHQNSYIVIHYKFTRLKSNRVYWLIEKSKKFHF